jgi:RNA polymerase sigma factor (sigma-70 family)
MDSAEATNTPLASAASSPNDLEIIAAIRAGATNQFETLVVRYQPKIFGMVRRYARREDEVEDIAQEIFVKAFQKLDSFRGDAPFEHWITRLAVRVRAFRARAEMKKILAKLPVEKYL